MDENVTILWYVISYHFHNTFIRDENGQSLPASWAGLWHDWVPGDIWKVYKYAYTVKFHITLKNCVIPSEPRILRFVCILVSINRSSSLLRLWIYFIGYLGEDDNDFLLQWRVLKRWKILNLTWSQVITTTNKLFRERIQNFHIYICQTDRFFFFSKIFNFCVPKKN